jgi:hypothetical protein
MEQTENRRETRNSAELFGGRVSSSTDAEDARPTLQERNTVNLEIWKTVATIVGFLLAGWFIRYVYPLLFTLLGLFSALGHYLLVKNLDGEPTDTSYISQSQVSAASILLTTIFKTALAASTAVCFTQHLWFVLRGNAMALPMIETLFTIRTNILALSDLQGIQRAPLLFSMALLIWCLGVATIYPPGALTVTLEPHNSITSHNITVMNPPLPLNYSDIPVSPDPDDALKFPSLGGEVYRMALTTTTGGNNLGWNWEYE